MFNLVYPGQYKRIIKSVRITMPCVTGPYTNVGAKLTLIESRIRENPNFDPILPTDKQISSRSISASNAQNDSGVFEFTFRDERYLPFEGAGAVESKWKLELPSAFRSFDYNTISDVMLHISYTAKDGDDEYREAVEKKIIDDLTDLASESRLSRLISLRHDFPTAFSKLLNPAQGGSQVTEFVIGKNYFPHFLSKMKLAITSTTILLKPKGDEPVDTDNLSLKINNKNIGNWTENTEIKHFMNSNVNLSGEPNRTWKIDAGIDGFSKEDLDDIIILINYKAEESN